MRIGGSEPNGYAFVFQVEKHQPREPRKLLIPHEQRKPIYEKWIRGKITREQMMAQLEAVA